VIDVLMPELSEGFVIALDEPVTRFHIELEHGLAGASLIQKHRICGSKL
jgi:hypothetical protein